MRASLWISALAAASAACASSFPPPTQRLIDAESSMREARAAGAEQDPRGAGHLKLANEELAQAKKAMQDGDEERAAYVLERAKADADLAAMLAREGQAEAQANQARAEAQRVGAELQTPAPKSP